MSKQEEMIDEQRPSWSYPQFIIVTIVLVLLVPVLGPYLGPGVFFTWLGYYLWISLSKKAFEKMHESYPSLTRGDYILNMMLIPGVFMALLILVMVLMAINRSGG